MHTLGGRSISNARAIGLMVVMVAIWVITSALGLLWLTDSDSSDLAMYPIVILASIPGAVIGFLGFLVLSKPANP